MSWNILFIVVIWVAILLVFYQSHRVQVLRLRVKAPEFGSTWLSLEREKPRAL